MKRPKATAVALSLILSINMLGCTKQQNKKIETSNDDFIEEMELQNDGKHYRVINMKKNQFSQKHDSRKNKFSLDDLEEKL